MIQWKKVVSLTEYIGIRDAYTADALGFERTQNELLPFMNGTNISLDECPFISLRRFTDTFV